MFRTPKLKTAKWMKQQFSSLFLCISFFSRLHFIWSQKIDETTAAKARGWTRAPPRASYEFLYLCTDEREENGMDKATFALEHTLKCHFFLSLACLFVLGGRSSIWSKIMPNAWPIVFFHHAISMSILERNSLPIEFYIRNGDKDRDIGIEGKEEIWNGEIRESSKFEPKKKNCSSGRTNRHFWFTAHHNMAQWLIYTTDRIFIIIMYSIYTVCVSIFSWFIPFEVHRLNGRLPFVSKYRWKRQNFFNWYSQCSVDAGAGQG